MRLLSMFKHGNKRAESGSSKLYLKLRSHFVVIFALVVLLPFSIFCFLSYNNFTMDMNKSYTIAAGEALNRTSSAVSYILGSMSSYSEMIFNTLEESHYFKTGLLQVLESHAPPSSADTSGLGKEIEALMLSNSDSMPVVNIYFIYEDKPIPIYSAHKAAAILDLPTCERWHEEVGAASGRSKLLGTNLRFYDDGSYSYVTSFGRAAKVPDNSSSSSAMLLIDMDYSSLATHINSIVPIGSQLYLTDSANSIMYGSDTSLLTTDLEASLFPMPSTSAPYITENMDGTKVRLMSRSIPSYDWRALSTMPADNSYGYSFFSKNYPIFFILLCCIVILVFSFVIKLIILNPLNELSAAVSPYNPDRYRPNLKLHEEAAPTPSAANDANALTDIQGLVHRVYSTKLEQQETRLRSLQSQINPHFLYNTLESIRGAALYHGISDIAEMSRCLSSLFRYSISDELLVPIKSELQNIEEYIAIQNFRHDNKFQLKYNISERLYEYKILKLTLQPMVENSIRHGLEMKLGKGSLTISMLSLDNTLRIQIADDGLGIPQEKIRQLNRQLSFYSLHSVSGRTDEEDIPTQGTGIGIQNVNSRIKLYFGDQYGVRYHECQAGAKVEMILPLITEEFQQLKGDNAHEGHNSR